MHLTIVSILLLLACTATADTLLVVNKRDATLALVDPATLKVTATVATGVDPHEVAVSDDGRIAVVTNYGSGAQPGTSLSVIDVASAREMQRFALPGLVRPHGVQAIGSRFYITAEGSAAVARYDAAGQRVDWIGGTGQDITHMLVVAADEKTLYATNIGSGTVTALDLTNAGEVGVKQIAAPRGVEAIDLAPDGSALWVAGVASRAEPARISVIDPKTNAVVRNIPVELKLANRLKFTPDGTRVAVSDPGTNKLAIFDAATGNVLKLIATAAGPAGLAFSRDGKRLYVACAGAGKVQVIDTATWTIAGEVETGAEPDGLAYVAK